MSVPATRPLLVLGVLCNERRPRWRERLRSLYAPFADRVLVRYVLSSQFQRRHGLAADEVGVPVGHGSDQHCAHKMVGWWSIAQRWPADYYAKTDDDAMLDLPRLLHVLGALPASGLYGGILRYSSINERTLEGVCWASGAFGALRQRASPRENCAHTRGPIVFAEGPFVLMSSDVQAWVAPRLRLDERQRCHFEDLLLGREVALREELRLVNLGPLLAEPNVFSTRGAWLGVNGPLAHWTRSDEAFNRTVDEFRNASSLYPPRPVPTLQCAPWRDSFPRVREFPCCANWSLCESDAASKEWSRQRIAYASAGGRRSRAGPRTLLHGVQGVIHVPGG